MSKGKISKSELTIINHNKKALDLQKQGQLTDALVFFIKAEELLKAYPSVKLQFLTYNNLACHFDKCKNLLQSLQYLSMCLNLRPADNSSSFFNIGILLNLSAIKSKLKLHEDALTHALKAFNLLESVQNPCLKCISYYTIALEYEYLNQISFAMNYFNDGLTFAMKFFGADHELTVLIHGALKAINSKSSGLVDSLCVLREKTTAFKSKKGFELKSRDNTQKGEYYIKVDTTPWLEGDSWKFKTHSETPKPHMKLRSFTKTSQELNKSLNFPVKLEEKLNFIGKKLATLNGKLSNIEKIFGGGLISEKINAAVIIQRAFRKYLRKKAMWKPKISIRNRLPKKTLDNLNVKTIPFFMVNGGLVKDNKSARDEKWVQTSGQGARNRVTRKKFKGLLENIVFLQKHFRGFLQRKRWKALRLSAILIQKTFRMQQVRKIYKNIRNAILFIQETYRVHLSKKLH